MRVWCVSPPKTGTFTLIDAFRAALGAEYIWVHGERNLQANLRRFKESHRLVQGHMPGTVANGDSRAVMAVILRDPIERLISEEAFLHEKMRTRQPFFAVPRAVMWMPWEQRVRHETMRNVQAKLLAGVPRDQKITKRQARKALRRFEIVGAFPDLQGFADLIGDRLGVPIPVARSDNRTYWPKQPVLPEMRRLNSVDYMLWEAIHAE